MHNKYRFDNKTIYLFHPCYYFSAGDVWDANRKLIMAFKNGEEKAIRIEYFQHSSLFMESNMIIIRALGHPELMAASEDKYGLGAWPTPLQQPFNLLIISAYI